MTAEQTISLAGLHQSRTWRTQIYRFIKIVKLSLLFIVLWLTVKRRRRGYWGLGRAILNLA